MNSTVGRGSERRLLVVFIGVCALLVAIGASVSMFFSARTGAASAIALGDVSEAHIVEIRDGRDGAAVLYGEFRTRVDALGNIEKDAALFARDGRTVIGEVELEIPASGRANRQPELEVDIMGLPPRESFSVVIDDRVVAVFSTDDRGSIDMELQEGEIPPAPQWP